MFYTIHKGHICADGAYMAFLLMSAAHYFINEVKLLNSPERYRD